MRMFFRLRFKGFHRDLNDDPDLPLLQDFAATMRTHATDLPVFDAFTTHWFKRVVV